MQLIEQATEVNTSDFYYDLFEGGYIDPHEQIDANSADAVLNAIEVIKEYKHVIQINDLLNEM